MRRWESVTKLLVEKLKALGIQAGPVYQQIKENEHITLDDGTIIYRKDVVGPAKQGKVITILGDTRPSSVFNTFVENSDILVHESTFNDNNKDLAHQYFHSTAVQAANLAKQSNCKSLVLTHISSRYQNEESTALLLEAKNIFPNTELASDFLQVNI
jgi:ribonuclease Z